MSAKALPTQEEWEEAHPVTLLHSFAANLASYQIRLTQFEGRDHIIVPVVMLTEGVHAGSGGPLYYPAEELAKFPAAWNGRPVPVLHPVDAGGLPISCNLPDVLQDRKVGQVFGAKYAGGKLTAQLWIDVNRLQQIDPELLNRINGKEPIEVSTGLFLDVENQVGAWNGENYVGIAKGFRPDHLALLPTGPGACSLKDGCGIRANADKKQTGEDQVKKEEKIKYLTDNGCACQADQLKALDEAVLDGMVKTIEQAVKTNAELATAQGALKVAQEEIEKLKTVKVEEPKTNEASKPPATVDEYVANAPEEMQAVLRRALARDRQMKTDLIEKIATNQKVFTKEELAGKPLDELEKLNALSAPANFTLAGGQPPAPGPVKEAPMVAPGLTFGK